MRKSEAIDEAIQKRKENLEKRKKQRQQFLERKSYSYSKKYWADRIQKK